MKKFEHEGKQYVEYNKVFSIVITAIVCFVIMFIVLVVFLIMQSNKIYSDPLTYGAKIYNIDYCVCKVNETATLNFDKQKVWTNPYLQGFNILPPVTS